MRVFVAIEAMLRNRRFWLWEVVGMLVYAIPVAVRFATKSIVIPILNFPGYWIGHFIPGNFLEKILVNAFFPGGAGGVAGEVFFNNYFGNAANKRTKYVFRLTGALLQTSLWSIFQYVGYSLEIVGPYGSNIFEHAVVFPINFTLAAFSIFTPDVIYLLKNQIFNHNHER
jgi:hypothetical protein